MQLIDRFLARGRRLSAPLVGYPAVAYTGTTIRAALHDPRIQADALLAYSTAARPDVLFPFMDLSVEAEALGLPVRFKEMDSPDVTSHPVRTADDLASLADPRVPDGGRMPVVLDTIRILERESQAIVGGYLASPFTLAGLLMSAEELSVGTMLDPELCDRVIETATGVACAYAAAQAQAGADFVVLLDPTAALLSPELYERFAGPAVRRVAESVSVPVALHVCGQTSRLIPSFLKDPVQALSLDSDVSLPDVAPQIPSDVAIMGNVSPVEVMLHGDADSVRAAVTNLAAAMAGYPNYIPSTGCDVPPGTARENLKAFGEAVRAL